jgi:hypothetical protein
MIAVRRSRQCGGGRLADAVPVYPTASSVPLVSTSQLDSLKYFVQLSAWLEEDHLHYLLKHFGDQRCQQCFEFGQVWGLDS